MTTKPNHYAGINRDELAIKAADIFERSGKPANRNIALFDCYFGVAEFIDFFESQDDVAIYLVRGGDYEDGGIENPITVDLN